MAKRLRLGPLSARRLLKRPAPRGAAYRCSHFFFALLLVAASAACSSEASNTEAASASTDPTSSAANTASTSGAGANGAGTNGAGAALSKASAGTHAATNGAGASADPVAPIVKPKADRLAAELLREARVRRDRGAPKPVAATEMALSQLPKKHVARKLIRATYKLTEDHLVFSADNAALPAARQLLQAVRELPSHGLTVDKYPLEAAEKALQAVDDLASAPADEDQGLKGPLALVSKWLDDVDPTTPVETLSKQLLDAGLTDEHADLVTRVREAQKEAFQRVAASQEHAVALDLALLECFYRYALDFRFNKVAHPFRAMRNPESGWSHFHDELIATFKATPMNDLETALRSWWPQNPQYAQMRAGLALYEQLAEADAQVEIPKGTYRKGATGESVVKLQKRLAQENYYAGEPNGTFDEALAAAVLNYQRTHQLDEDAVVGGTTTKSMNVSFKRRAEQVRLGLQRWRESDARWESDFYFRVNVPEFVVDLWNGATGERVRRHNVVVGSNAWEQDPERGIEGKLNRTMLFSGQMEIVVLNPMWHVPRRIIDTEIRVEMEEDPEYITKHNYTVEENEDGTMRVSQGSGPGNALGLVKFLFPNEFSIYMHDTPKKRLFSRTIRAFSHGCIRVEDPMDLARYLLIEKEGKLDENEFNSTLRTERERGIRLTKPIPVHIEYNTVSVSDDGHIRFLLDVYGYDAEFYDGKVPLPKRNFKALDG